MNTPPNEPDGPITESITTPQNRRSLLPIPPDAPYISRPRQRSSHVPRRTPRVPKGKIVKEKIQGNTMVTPNQLIRFLIFGERKKALTIIRKDSLYYTLTRMEQKVPKSANLGRLLETLSVLSGYEKRKQMILQNIVRIQGYIRKFIKNRLKRAMGPGFPITKCVNEDCPYSLETLSDIPSEKIMTWREPFRGIPSKIYGCDVDMLIESLRRDIRPAHVRKLESPRTQHGERIKDIINPFTREGLTVDVIRRCNEYTLLKKYTPLYRSSGPVRRPSRSRTTSTHDLHNEMGRRRRRGIGSRYLNLQDDDSDDMINERHTSTIQNPLFYVDTLPPFLFGTPRDAIQHLERLLPIAEAVSESFRDLEFYTQETMFTKAITDTIATLRRIEDNSIDVDLLQETASYVDTHILPLIDALSVGTNYPTVTSILTRICANNNRSMSPSLRRRVRQVFQQFRSGARLRSIALGVIETRNLLDTPRVLGESRANIVRLADLVYRTIGGILLLTHPSLKDYPELSSEEDRKSLAIIFIGSFFEAGYLGEEFSWARFRI